MADISPENLERIALHLLTFRNPRAKRELGRRGLLPSQLQGWDAQKLLPFGFSPLHLNGIHDGPLQLAEREVEGCQRSGIEIIFREEEDFPELLRQIFDPPDFIYLLGKRERLSGDKVAVVGSRRASPYGLRALRRIIPELSAAGLGIVSGMAYGIDSMAHQLALSCRGNTIGVNAGGLRHLYPQGNLSLIGKIRDQGAVISEFPLDLVPRPYLFPIRNRLISGLARAVLVVEATLRSGSLITAKLGLEQNREIMAVPGPIDSPLSGGTHYLLQQGAKLVCQASDILEEFGLSPVQAATTLPPLNADEKKLLDLLGENGVNSIDYLVETLNLSPSEVISMIMGLILKNLVVEEAGSYRCIGHAS